MKSIHREMELKNTAILLIHCPDRQGILAAVTEFLMETNGKKFNLNHM